MNIQSETAAPQEDLIWIENVVKTSELSQPESAKSSPEEDLSELTDRSETVAPPVYKMNYMYCPSCGKEIPDSSVFCLHCGKSVNQTVQTTSTSDTQPRIIKWE